MADVQPQDPAPETAREPAFSRRRVIGLALGVGGALALQLLPRPEGLSPQAWAVASLAVLMACWWVSEAVPIAVTSLLPLVILPLAGVSSFAEAARGYAHPVVMLLLGGFIIAKGVERWNLHARIALAIVARAGTRASGLVLGFMIAAALLSMWISNTATTLMMTPIALSVAAILARGRAQSDAIMACLLLGVAYAASIGGMGTPVGTPTNLIVMGALRDQAGVDLSFGQWMGFAAPVVLVMIPATWWVLTRLVFRVHAAQANEAQAHVRRELAALGPLTTPEARTLMVFAVIATLWVFGRPLSQWEIAGVTPLAGLSDPVTAILGVVLLFLVPSGSTREPGSALLDWASATQIPWGVYLLFGGGLSLASAISSTGLAPWLGDLLAPVNALPVLLVILILVVFVISATELVSNVAAVSALMPVVLAVAGADEGLSAAVLSAPVALAASCAFMLPMATGPNAIVFGAGGVRLPTMIRAGFRVNLVAVLIITALSAVLAPRLLA